MNPNWNEIKNWILDLVYPVLCQGCFREGSYLCAECQAKISPPLEHCPICGQPSLLGKIHPACKKASSALEGIMVIANYQDQSIHNLIWHLKYHSVQPIADILALLMTDYFISRNLLDYFRNAVVVPVPLFKKRRLIRGFNQAEILAENFAKKLGFQYLPILRRIRNTQSQVDLSRPERICNVRNAFTISPMPVIGERKIILVDDIATTGATLNECAKALKAYGAKEIWGLVVAKN